MAASDDSQREPMAKRDAASAGRGVRVALSGQVVIFFAATVLALATASECHSITYVPSLIYGAVLWGWWGCIASVLWRMGQRSVPISNFSSKAIAVQVLLGSVLGVVHLTLLGSTGFLVGLIHRHDAVLAIRAMLVDVNRFGIELLIYGFVFGITGIAQSQVRAQREAMKSLELQQQLSVAHLRALQMQMEPHFLFNTLNAITTLVELGRQTEAAEMLSHLNAMLKSTLKRTTPEKVPLSQELELVENYLAIEQVRFADRLRIEIKVEPGALEGLVPCFLLQPIVENAIRHGIAQCENEGVVQASARREGEMLHLRVRDSGSGRSGAVQSNGHGIGLKNTRERLAHFYRQEYAMRAEPVMGGGFEVAIAIPYERG